MSVQLNHTIVSCRDQQRSAAFLTGILGLPAPARFGHFLRLRRILDRAVACGTGLRREGMHAKRPEGPALSRQCPPLSARALPAQVKLANPVYPVYPVPCADRRPAPITRLIHLQPPAGPPLGPCPRCHTILTAHHVKSAFPDRPPIAAIGHDLGAPSASCLSLIQSGRSPARYRPAPDARPRSKTARNTSGRALSAR